VTISLFMPKALIDDHLTVRAIVHLVKKGAQDCRLRIDICVPTPRPYQALGGSVAAGVTSLSSGSPVTASRIVPRPSVRANYNSADARRRVASRRWATLGFRDALLQSPSAMPFYPPHQLKDISHVKPNDEEKADDAEDRG
jgi:hypothetical protein